ncbi:MAG: 1-deoxy-D-xylulose-5-phosphate reductoisomerase [Fimbriimonadales bacterium]|nr:1-deoxy-D-xylulose-5-phosphate reductoisomerase [Fimbriimonadales bacterium]
MKNVALIGSTGSIGTQTLEVIRHHPDRIRVYGLAARANVDRFCQQVKEFQPVLRALFERDPAQKAQEVLGQEVLSGMEGLLFLATHPEVDIVVISVSGMIGLEPTLSAIGEKKHIALASKEVLVAGGAVVMPQLKESGATLMPIDSEHSAILQCVQETPLKSIEKIYLTASGGPFRGWTREQMKDVTVEQALNHPTWKMGGKITIDSATLMNKGLEIIEACWLFDLSPEQVEVWVHPQSIIHSMVKFRDGSVLAQMGHPDMRLPIQYALLGPERLPSPAKPWEPLHTPQLTFEPLDTRAFPCPELAKEAYRRGGVVATYLNAVNEEAVHAFLRGEIPFLKIFEWNEASLSRAPKCEPTLPHILQADEEARQWVRSQMLPSLPKEG